jgi:hypothetical protein
MREAARDRSHQTPLTEDVTTTYDSDRDLQICQSNRYWSFGNGLGKEGLIADIALPVLLRYLR